MLKDLGIRILTSVFVFVLVSLAYGWLEQRTKREIVHKLFLDILIIICIFLWALIWLPIIFGV